jgi:DNA polymerase-1
MRSLIIDGDVLVYQFAHSCQVETRWERDVWMWHANAQEARCKVAQYMDELLERTDSDELFVALSDLDGNFRKSVCSSYKANRAGIKRPLLFGELRRFFLEEYEAVVFPNLEGDDVLGIMGTDPCHGDDEVVIASIDKDMKTVPGLHYDWTHHERGVVEITPWEAKRNHLIQTMTGDATDGYGGCPGIGPVRAAKVLEGMDLHEEKSWWDEVVKAFRKAKLNEYCALEQARLAYILQYGDYDEDTHKVSLWEPTG